MGVFDIFQRSKKAVSQTKKEKRRSYSSTFYSFINDLYAYFSTSSGEVISGKTALSINSVFVSCRILGETTASFTFETVEKQGDNRIPIETPVSRIFGVMANEKYGITAYNFWNLVLLHLGTHGNHYSHIERNRSGVPTGLLPFYPYDIEVFIDDELGVFYKHTKTGKTYLREDILHFKTMGWSGIVGVNPIQEARELMGLAQKIGKYAGNVYGKKPPGYISTDQVLQRDNIKDIGDSWDNSISGDNVGKTPVLHAGMKYHQVMLSMADVEYIKTKNITSDEIYSLYRIPPTLAQNYDRATWSNAEQQDLVLMKYTMLPYVRNFEQEIQAKMLNDNIKAKFNMNSLLRGDIKTRNEAYALMWDRGVLSDNEWRKKEDINPKVDGDLYWKPINYNTQENVIKNGAQNNTSGN